MKRKVVITGIGCVAAIGIGHQACWENLLNCRSMLREIDCFDTSSFPVKKAGLVKGLDISAHLSPILSQQTDRHTHLALVATHLALEDAKLDLEREDRERVGTIIGNNLGGSIFGEEQLQQLHARGARAVSPFQSIAWFYAATIGQISIKYGLKGYSKTYVADRAGSLFALGDAFRAIQRGDLDICLAGGCEAPVSPYALVGYLDTGLLSNSCCSQDREQYAPFDKERNGLILGEGSGILVLEERERALQRGATLYGELCGFGQTCDAVNYRAVNLDGVQYARAITNALADGQVAPGDLGYVSVDGCADFCADIREANAIKRVFGDDTASLQVSCPKTMFGHLFGAANAIDTAIACLVFHHGYVPATAHVYQVDPLCSLPLVTHQAVRARGSHALILGTARGGMNAALVARRC